MLRAASSTERRVGGKRSPPGCRSSSLMPLDHPCLLAYFERSLCRMADADKHGLWGAQGGWRRLRTRPESKEEKKSRQGYRRHRRRRGQWKRPVRGWSLEESRKLKKSAVMPVDPTVALRYE